PHVCAAADAPAGAVPGDRRGPGVIGALQHAGRRRGFCRRTGRDQKVMLTDSQINEGRSRFRVFDRKIYLNTCSQGALSDGVQAGFKAYLASWHEQGSPWERWIEHYEAARAAFAQFINASPEEVAIVTSVSAGINSIASALNFRERPRVVM